MSGEKEIVLKIDTVIENLENDLRRYVNKGKVNQFIVEKNNGYIERLTDARNFIAKMANSIDYHVMISLMQEIADLERKDPELTGHIIKLCKRKGDRFGYLLKCY